MMGSTEKLSYLILSVNFAYERPLTNLSGMSCVSQLIIIIKAQKVYILRLVPNVSTKLLVIHNAHITERGTESSKKSVGGLNGFGPVFTLKTHDLRFLRNGTSDRNEKRGPLL